MESIDVNLDRVVDILYDEKSLHWNRVKSTDIIAFGESKFNLTISAAEKDYVLQFLIDEGYINEIKNKDLTIDYQLTLKGVQLKQSGGFANKTKIEKRKELLYQWSIKAVIVAGLYYTLETLKIILHPWWCW